MHNHWKGVIHKNNNKILHKEIGGCWNQTTSREVMSLKLKKESDLYWYFIWTKNNILYNFQLMILIIE